MLPAATSLLDLPVHRLLVCNARRCDTSPHVAAANTLCHHDRGAPP